MSARCPSGYRAVSGGFGQAGGAAGLIATEIGARRFSATFVAPAAETGSATAGLRAARAPLRFDRERDLRAGADTRDRRLKQAYSVRWRMHLLVVRGERLGNPVETLTNRAKQ